MSYEIRRLGCSEDDIAEYVKFLSSSYSLSSSFTGTSKANSKYLTWQYVDNPLGKFIGYGAFFENQMVSHFATLPVQYKIDGIVRKGLLALNLVTHPEHRGKGLFIQIAAKTLADAKNEGYEFAVGVANQNSSYGLIQKLGFSHVGQLSVIVGIGSILPNETCEYRLQSVWSNETLKWRLSNPNAKSYKSVNNTVVTSTGKFSIYAQLTGRRELQLSSNALIRKYTPLKVWIGLSKSIKKRGIFFKLPNKLRPVPLNLIYKNLNGPNEIFKQKDVFFELIDFDAY